MEKLVATIKNTYKGENVVVKKEVGYYRLYADFIDKKRTDQVGKDMIKKKLIVDYYIF